MLEAGAKQEGSVTWYTSLAGSIIKDLTDGFKAKYPFIQTTVFRAPEDKLIERATQEGQAGKNSFDVLESPISAILLFNGAKLITPYFSPAASSIPAKFITPSNNHLALGITDRIGLIGFGYNTKLLPDTAVPRKLEDLLAAPLKGKLALAGTTTGSRWLGSVLHAKGGEQGQQFLSQLAKQQDVSVQQISGKALLDLVVKGEVPASPTIYREHVEEAADNKGSVKWAPLVTVGNVGQLAMATKAPHPHAALLYIDYVLGEGRNALKKLHYAVATEPPAIDFWIPESGRTAQQIEDDLNHWTEIFRQDFR